MSRLIVFVLTITLVLMSSFVKAGSADNELTECISFKKIDIECVKKALAAGADPNWVSNTGRKYSVIGHLSRLSVIYRDHKEEKYEASITVAKLLFNSGTKLQSCDKEILFFPIAEGNTQLVEILLKNGADPERKIEGLTPIEWAEGYGYPEIVDLLAKYGAQRIDPRDAAQLVLINAAGYGDISRMKEALDKGAHVNGTDSKGRTALLYSLKLPIVHFRDAATVLFLLEQGANPNLKGDIGIKTPALHKAIYGTSGLFSDTTKVENLKGNQKIGILILEAVIKSGAYVSSRNEFEETPLHIAAQYNNIVGAKMLIAEGCKIMPRENRGKTPLDYAESGEMIKLLKKHGAVEH